MDQIIRKTRLSAEKVLASRGDIDAGIAAVSDYVEALGVLLIELEVSHPDLNKAGLEQVARLHGQVIDIALALLGDTSAELKQLQSKGKAILAYTDTMPKRVSIRPEKKG